MTRALGTAGVPVRCVACGRTRAEVPLEPVKLDGFADDATYACRNPADCRRHWPVTL